MKAMRCALRRLCLMALVAGMGGCLPHQNAAMFGNAEGVSINYAGDVSETIPIARRHCAQFERRPILRGAKENTAIYECVRSNAGP